MRLRISRIVMDYVTYFILAYKQYVACNLAKRVGRVGGLKCLLVQLAGLYTN